MASTPLHFDLPFKFGSGNHAAAVEQDTAEDITNCVVAAVLTEQGFRPEVPGFGVPSQIFKLQPVNLEVVLAAVANYEPRASLLGQQTVDTEQLFTNKQEVIAAITTTSV